MHQLRITLSVTINPLRDCVDPTAVNSNDIFVALPKWSVESIGSEAKRGHSFISDKPRTLYRASIECIEKCEESNSSNVSAAQPSSGVKVFTATHVSVKPIPLDSEDEVYEFWVQSCRVFACFVGLHSDVHVSRRAFLCLQVRNVIRFK